MCVNHMGYFMSRPHQLELLVQLIQRREGGTPSCLGYVQIDHCGLDVRMAQQLFNGDDIHSIFQQVCGIGMSQGVHSYLLLDTCFFRYFPDHPLHTAWRKTFMPDLSIEEPFEGVFGF